MVHPHDDAEVRPVITTMKVEESSSEDSLFWEERFCKFSSWNNLVHGLSLLKLAASRKTFHVDEISVKNLKAAEQLILKKVQEAYFRKEIKSLKSGKAVADDSSLSPLQPYLEEEELLRIGERLKRANLSIVPKRSHIAILLARHYHNRIHHQGRHITAGVLRSAGFWIVGAKELVSSVVHKCITCKRLRGKLQMQIMADLPACRLQPVPPFTYVGVDTFRHWTVM